MENTEKDQKEKTIKPYSKEDEEKEIAQQFIKENDDNPTSTITSARQRFIDLVKKWDMYQNSDRGRGFGSSLSIVDEFLKDEIRECGIEAVKKYTVTLRVLKNSIDSCDVKNPILNHLKIIYEVMNEIVEGMTIYYLNDGWVTNEKTPIIK